MKEILDSIFSNNIIRVVLVTLPFLVIILNYIFYNTKKFIKRNTLLSYYNCLGINSCVSYLLSELSMEFNPSVIFIELNEKDTSYKTIKIDNSIYKGDKHSDIIVYVDIETKEVKLINVVNKGLIEISLKMVEKLK